MVEPVDWLNRGDLIPVPFADDLASNSLLISSGVAMIAVFLGLRQWYEWRARDSELSELDHRYFVRQDVRRGLGVAVMLVIAAGLYFGSRIPPKVAGRANLTFIEVWLAIVGLIIVMLLLAFVDWVSTRIYARRQQPLDGARTLGNPARNFREEAATNCAVRPRRQCRLTKQAIRTRRPGQARAELF